MGMAGLGRWRNDRFGTNEARKQSFLASDRNSTCGGQIAHCVSTYGSARSAEIVQDVAPSGYFGALRGLPATHHQQPRKIFLPSSKLKRPVTA